MRFSEAMRKGAAIRPQAYNEYFSEVWDVEKQEYTLCSCAIGAAYEGATGRTDLTGTRPAEQPPLPEFFSILFEAEISPEFFSILFEAEISSELFFEITRMNDEEHASREEIADWLESKGI